MSVTEKFLLYDLSRQLIDDNYKVLFVNLKHDEIWLTKSTNTSNEIIRIINKRFDWKNRLKNDVITVINRAKAMETKYTSKRINIKNIYITDLEPVDDWKGLLKPLEVKGNFNYLIETFYLTVERRNSELLRLGKSLSISFDINELNSSDEDKDVLVKKYQNIAINNVYEQKKQQDKLFNYGKPFMTYILMVINIIMFIILELNGGSTNLPTLIVYGAKYNPAIIDGEWWRFVSSMFLHIGYIHLFMNMLALYYLGTLIEKIYGSVRFLGIYFLSGIAGSLLSFVLSTNVSAGASGALFGMFGALLFFGINNKKIFFKTFGKSVILILIINISFGYLIPQIDMGAHIGGLIGGFIAASITCLPHNKNILLSLIGTITYVMIFIYILLFGIESNESDAMYLLMQTEENIAKENFDEAISYASRGIELEEELQAELHFQRAYAYIESNNNQAALIDLKESIEIQPVFPEAYYNLALLYFDNNQINLAKKNIDIAIQQAEDKKAFKKAHDKIYTKE